MQQHFTGDNPTQAVRDRGHSRPVLAGIADDGDVVPAAILVLLEPEFEVVAADLFLAFDHELHVDRQLGTLTKEPGVSLHLVLDNSATHKTPAVKRWFLRHPEYHLHFIPTSSSWLNQVERFFAEITEKRIRRGAFKSVPALEKAITEYLTEHNLDPKPFKWVADADAILERIQKVCDRTSDSGH